MAKRHAKTPVVMNKARLLLPKMEFLVLDEATGEGLYVRELGGKSLLEYRELTRNIEGEPTVLQAVELMVEMVLRTACNADGTHYFDSKDEVIQFAEASLARLQNIADLAMKLSGIEAKNNLKNDPNSSSTDS